MLKYSTSRRFSPDTTDPETGARIADPDVYGKVTEDGSFKVSSWPEVRKMYQANQFDEEFKQDARFKKLKPYLEGKTNILTERYDEPYFSLDKKGNIQRNTLTGKMMSPRSDVRLTESEHSSLMKQMKKEHPGYEFGEHERVGVDIGSLKNGKLGKPVSMGSATVASMRSKSKSEAETEDPIEKKTTPTTTPTTPDIQISSMPYKKKRKVSKPELIGEADPKYTDPGKPGRAKLYTERKFKGKRIKGTPRERQKFVERHLIGAGERKRYKKEEKLAKATYGRGYEDMDRSQLEAKKQKLKQERRDFLGAAGRRGIKALSAARETGKEIRDIRRAQKYQDLVGTGGLSVSEYSGPKSSSKAVGRRVKYFTPEKMQGYRSSSDNPLNRNSYSKYFK